MLQRRQPWICYRFSGKDAMTLHWTIYSITLSFQFVSQCTESEDYVEFLAGNYLDNSYMRQDAILCGAAGHVNSVVSEDRRSGAAATSPNTPHTPPLTDVLHLSSACTHGNFLRHSMY